MSVPASVADPVYDADVNVLGLLNVLEASKDNNVRKIIFISSGGAVYGEAEEFPTTEDYPPRPMSPYAITKFVSEKYLDFYSHQYGLDYTVLRYANVYGPRQVPHGEAGVVAIFMNRILSNVPSTLFHYPDEPRGMIRDYCYAGDVARANLMALEKGSRGVYNIGTGVPVHTLELYNGIYEAIREMMPDVPAKLRDPDRGAARPGDLNKSCLKIERAARELGWEPEVRLGEGLRKTLLWRLKK